MGMLNLFKKVQPHKIVALRGIPSGMRLDAVVKVKRIFDDTSSELIDGSNIMYYAVEFRGETKPRYSWQVNAKAVKHFFQRRNYKVISIVLH